MRYICLFSLAILLLACTNRQLEPKDIPISKAERHIVIPEFQAIVDSAGLAGSIVIYDLTEDRYYSNNFAWARNGHLPASTFKIPNSIIALETGVVEDDSTLFVWGGEKRRLKVWEQDLAFKEAFHHSCVPCYQEVARNIGAARMADYLHRFNYGNMKVDSGHIDMFWLQGDSRINQLQQIDFLERFYKGDLPISDRTEAIMKRMMVIEDNEKYKLSGKTGWSVTNGSNNGWFVGFIETQSKVYFLATNVEPNPQFDMNMFAMIRKDITITALKQMQIMY